jgi:hypothetical protein
MRRISSKKVSLLFLQMERTGKKTLRLYESLLFSILCPASVGYDVGSEQFDSFNNCHRHSTICVSACALPCTVLRYLLPYESYQSFVNSRRRERRRSCILPRSLDVIFLCSGEGGRGGRRRASEPFYPVRVCGLPVWQLQPREADTNLTLLLRLLCL